MTVGTHENKSIHRMKSQSLKHVLPSKADIQVLQPKVTRLKYRGMA